MWLSAVSIWAFVALFCGFHVCSWSRCVWPPGLHSVLFRYVWWCLMICDGRVKAFMKIVCGGQNQWNRLEVEVSNSHGWRRCVPIHVGILPAEPYTSLPSLPSFISTLFLVSVQSWWAWRWWSRWRRAAVLLFGRCIYRLEVLFVGRCRAEIRCSIGDDFECCVGGELSMVAAQHWYILHCLYGITVFRWFLFAVESVYCVLPIVWWTVDGAGGGAVSMNASVIEHVSLRVVPLRYHHWFHTTPLRPVIHGVCVGT